MSCGIVGKPVPSNLYKFCLKGGKNPDYNLRIRDKKYTKFYICIQQYLETIVLLIFLHWCHVVYSRIL